MKLLATLQRSLDFWFVLAVSCIFFLLRLPSFFEPYWYGDEGVYEVLGYGIRHGRLLYQGIWDNKPPLLYLIYALFDGNQTYVRVFSFFVGLVTIFIFFLLAKLLFRARKSIYIATICFVLFLGLPLIEGNIANAENFMVLPIVGAMYLLARTIAVKKYSFPIIFSSGILLGISFLIKVVAVFDFATAFLLIGFVLFSWNRKALFKLIGRSITLCVGFLLPFVLTLGFFALKGFLKIFIQSAFLSNVSYVNYGNQLLIPQGFLIFKLLVLFIVIVFIFLKRNSLSLSQLLIYLWIPFSLYNAFFSQRPYTHYMLVLLGCLSLLAGLIFEKKWTIRNIILFGIVAILLYKNFWFYSKTIGYYENFQQFLTGSLSTSQYGSFFDKGVPRDYAIADFMTRNVKTNQFVFLWSNSAQIYYLSKRLPLGRYTVAYHMTTNAVSLNETYLDLKRVKPDFIILLPNAPTFPFSMKNYRLKIALEDGLIYEKIF